MPELLSEILSRCRAGDELAVAELVRRFWPWAVDFAAALLGDAHLAEDAVQSAFVTALAKLHQLRETQGFAGWFRQIVRTEANRIARRRHATVPLIEQPAAAVRDVTEAQRIVREALAALPPGSAEAATLHYLDQLSCREIARRLAVPQGTVKRRLHDARLKLRELLARQIPL